METKQLAANTRQHFWTSFGQYMHPVPSSSGEKINWINYKTGVKFIKLVMQWSDGKATAALELSNPETTIRQAQFDQLLTFKKQFQQICGNDWLWEKEYVGSQKNNSSRIAASIENVYLLKQDDWPAIITFFKERMILLDQFWNDYQFALQ